MRSAGDSAWSRGVNGVCGDKDQQELERGDDEQTTRRKSERVERCRPQSFRTFLALK